MSTIKINSLQVGQSANSLNNYTLYQPASPDGTVRLGQGNPGSVTDHLIIDSSGRVGIGTSSPSSKLHIQSAADTTFRVSSTSGSSWFVGNAPNGLILHNEANAATIFTTNGTEKMRIDSAGNVGIGTTSPSYKVDVAGVIQSKPASGTYGQIILNNQTSGSWKSLLSFHNGATAKWELGVDPANNGTNSLYFWDSAASSIRMLIDSAGNVGIGDTYPGGTGADKSLVVATSGNLCIVKGYTTSTASTASARFDWAIGRANAYVISALNDNNGAPYFIINTGSGVTGPMYMQNGTGGVYLSRNATSWTANSDERVKDIIEPITGAVDKLATLRTVFGKYKDDVNGVRRPFLIAQDLQKVYPEVVTEPAPLPGQDFAPLGVSYTDLVPVLVAAINELSERLATLEAKQQ